VFAERGYDGTRVADIAAAAGVSNGALYAHFGSKAELLVAALRVHGRRVLAEMLAADPGCPVADLLVRAGRGLSRRPDARGYLMVEALVAARRDGEVAGPMRCYTAERADWLAGLIEAGQAAGELDAGLSPDAVAHFCLLLAFGGALLPADLHPVEDAAWTALLARVVAGLAPAGLAPAGPAPAGPAPASAAPPGPPSRAPSPAAPASAAPPGPPSRAPSPAAPAGPAPASAAPPGSPPRAPAAQPPAAQPPAAPSPRDPAPPPRDPPTQSTAGARRELGE
jgi:AcrR family transcriptional regulator